MAHNFVPWDCKAVGIDKVNAELLVDKKQNAFAIIFDNAADLINSVKANSPSAFVKDGETPPHGDVWSSKEGVDHRLRGRNGGDEWVFGTDKDCNDFDKLNDLLDMGKATPRSMKFYEEAHEKILRDYPELSKLQDIAVAKRRRRVSTDDGSELDICKGINGDAECWTKKSRRSGAKKSVRIVYDMGTSAGTDADSFPKAMAAVVTLCDIIERAGITTEILMVATAKNICENESYKTLGVKVKRYGERLDVSRLLSLGQSGTYRTHIFQVWANVSDTNPSYGLGSAIGIDEKKKVYSGLWDAAVHVQGIDWYASDSAMEVVINSVKTAIGLSTAKDFADAA